MASDYLVTAQAIAQIVKAAAPALKDAATQYEPPVWYPYDQPHLAVYFTEEVMGAGGRLDSGTTDSRDFTETYVIDYWQPATNEGRALTAGPVLWENLQEAYSSVRDAFLTTANMSLSTGVWRLWLSTKKAQSLMRPEQAAEGIFIRGFRVTLEAHRNRAFIN